MNANNHLTRVQLNGLAQAFSPETVARLQEIHQEIEMHQNTLAYLQSVWCPPKGTPVKFKNHYRPTKEDIARLPKTVANLRQQIQWLQHEAEVLQRYGR